VLKILKFFDADPDPGFRIFLTLDPASKIVPQYCLKGTVSLFLEKYHEVDACCTSGSVEILLKWMIFLECSNMSVIKIRHFLRYYSKFILLSTGTQYRVPYGGSKFVFPRNRSLCSARYCIPYAMLSNKLILTF
jgi:hypothetical protein